MVRRWTAVLHELDPGCQESTGSLPATPSSFGGGSGSFRAGDGLESDEDWQELGSGLLPEGEGLEPQLAAVGDVVFEDENDPEGPRMTFRCALSPAVLR